MEKRKLFLALLQLLQYGDTLLILRVFVTAIHPDPPSPLPIGFQRLFPRG
jgi:hypothetical protein